MKKIIVIFIFGCSLILSASIHAQVGIGTTSPDPSAILELSSDHQGFLMPRLSTVQRDLISSPATGLLIYNLSISEIQVNAGTTIIPIWLGMKTSFESTASSSVTATGDISTSSTTDELIPGMTLSPPAGTYLALFNAQYGFIAGTPVNTTQAVADLTAAINEVNAIPATNTTHAAVMGNGETLTPGVYTFAAAASLAGDLTLDGGNDTNSVFIFRVGGALSTGAGVHVILTNGARARNIFWFSVGALSLAANTIMKGTLMSNAAVSAAAGSNLEGRMFTTAGAISMGPGTIAAPSGESYIDLGVLSTFIIFTTAGALANTDPSTMTGDVGTNVGAITGFENLNGNIYYPGSPPPAISAKASFCIYQNGILVANSGRTTDANTSLMVLQAMATVTAGQTIEVRWNVDEGAVTLGNRILTLVNAN